MEKRISNLVNMIRATILYCVNNAIAVMGIPAFTTTRTAIETKLVLIDQLEQIAEGTSTGVTLDTNAIRNAMTNIAFKCCNALIAYAASVNNNTLMAKVKFTISDLRGFKKEVIDGICQTIHDEANLNIAAAGSFGYMATDVTDLQTAIDLYRTAIQNPRQAIISKTLAIEQINNISRDIVDNSLVLGLDKMANTLLLTNPVFVSGYKHSREVINIGSTHAKVRGTIKNEEEIPLVGVTFFITVTGQANKVTETQSITGGKFTISNLLPNDYDFYWEYLGYQNKVETNVHIAAGKEIRRNVTLLHLPPITGTINSGQLINIFGPLNPEWRVGATIKIKNTTTTPMIGGINFFPALNPGDSFSGEGSTLLSGQEETHIITASEFKPYLNIQNQGPNSGTYEITIL